MECAGEDINKILQKILHLKDLIESQVQENIRKTMGRKKKEIQLANPFYVKENKQGNNKITVFGNEEGLLFRPAGPGGGAGGGRRRGEGPGVLHGHIRGGRRLVQHSRTGP